MISGVEGQSLSLLRRFLRNTNNIAINLSALHVFDCLVDIGLSLE